MKITELKIRLLHSPEGLGGYNREHYINLPVDIELLESSDKDGSFKIDEIFKLTVDSNLFKQYGNVEISRYGTISRSMRVLPGITELDSAIHLTWRIVGYVTIHGNARIEFKKYAREIIGATNSLNAKENLMELEEIATGCFVMGMKLEAA